MRTCRSTATRPAGSGPARLATVAPIPDPDTETAHTRTTASPYRNVEHAFKIADVVAAAGASYVSRWTTYHPRPLTRSIKKGIQKKGFALIEAVSQCPVQFGRVSKIGKAVDILKFFKENSIRIDKASGMSEEELEGKIIIGEFADKEKVELSSQWIELSKQMMQEEGESCHVKS